MADIETDVRIASTDVRSNVLSWRTDEEFGQEISQCESIVSKSIYTTLPTLSIGNAITIKRGATTSTDEFIFEGQVYRIVKEGATVKLICWDNMLTLINTQMTYSYDSNIDPSAGVGSEIAKDLIETHGGLTATVVSTGSVILIKKFICNNVSVYDKLRELADVYDYAIFYDPTDSTVHFEPKGYVVSGTTLTIGSNVVNLPKWDYDFSQCFNKIKVIGAEQINNYTEVFDGTGAASQQNTLAKIPRTVVASVGGTIKTPGVSGVTSGSYDYETDIENKQINWNQSFNPGVGVGNISISYDAPTPIPVLVSRDSSITSYGLKETSKTFSGIQTVEDAESAGNGFLDKYAEPFVSTVLKPDSTITTLNVGNRVRAVDTLQNEDRELVINKIVRRWPYQPDELQVGDRLWKVSDWGRMTMDRIKRLEEINNKNTDILIDIRQLPKILRPKRRYLQVLNPTVGGSNLFILGHPTYGILGTGQLGATDLSAETQVRLVWPNQKVIEKFLDTDFEHTNTTADWADSVGTCVFTNGEIAESEVIYDNAVNITSAKLTASSTTNLTFEMQVDNSNWESCTSGTELTFANTGQQLKFRVTASGNATLSEITIEVIEA